VEVEAVAVPKKLSDSVPQKLRAKKAATRRNFGVRMA
jgi:hypothetical protein